MKHGALALTLLLQSCVYLPHTATVYDADCRIYAKQMRLAIHEVGLYMQCRNEGCVAQLVAAGAVSAATAVVSGSIVVAGNVVYWFEKQGRCERDARQPGAAVVPVRLA